MKLFGGFGGARSYGTAKKQIKEEKTRPAEDAPRKRTPAELAEIERIIAAYQKKKRKRRLIALAVIVLLALFVFAAYKIIVRPPDIVQPTIRPDASDSPEAPGTAEPTHTQRPSPTPGETTDPSDTSDPEAGATAEPVVKTRRSGVYTALIVGREQSFGNTDTLMVAVYDSNNGKLNVLSIPRDTCANVTSNPALSETKKINSVFARAKIDGLKDAVSTIVGFPIDCYVSVGVNGFVHLVDTIGGVYFDVPYYMDYDDPTQDLHIHFDKGYQYLNGTEAIKVVRWRQNNDGSNYGDIARINNQQNFLKTVLRQCLSWTNLKNNLSDYVDIFHDYVSTDLSSGNMLWYAQQVLKMSMDDIHFYTLPVKASDNIRGFSYGTILLDDWMKLVNEIFPVYDQPITLDDVDIITRDSAGNLYATSGSIKGGYDSFLDYNDYIRRLKEWNEQQAKKAAEEAAKKAAEEAARAAENTEKEAD